MERTFKIAIGVIISFVLVYSCSILYIVPKEEISRVNAVVQVVLVGFIAIQVLAAAKNVDESIKSRINVDELKWALIGYLEKEALKKIKENSVKNTGFERVESPEDFLKRDYIKAQSLKIHPTTQAQKGYEPSVIELGHIIAIGWKIGRFLRKKGINLEDYNNLIERGEKSRIKEESRELYNMLSRLLKWIKEKEAEAEEELLKLY